MPILRTRDRSSRSTLNNFRLRPVSVLQTWPAVPTFVGSTGSQSTGSASVGWPTGTVAGDFAILIVETSGDEAFAAPSGWTAVSGSPVIDVADATGSTLSVFYRTAPTGLASTTLAASVDHKVFQIATFNGVSTTAVLNVVTGTKTTASTSLTFPSYTVPSKNNLVLFIASHPVDIGTAQFSAMTNSNLTSITNRINTSTTNGNGGGFCLYTGISANFGLIGTSTATVATSCTNACMVLALEPSIAYAA